MYHDKVFWTAAAERSLKTFFQTLAAALGTDAAGVLSVDPVGALSISLAAALLSLVTSLASADIGPAGPAIAGDETPAPRTVGVERIVEVPAKKAPARKAAAPKKAASPAPAKKAAPKKK